MADKLRFKVDENLPVEVADHLRQAGYDAVAVSEQHLSGSPDTVAAAVCTREKRVFITLDTDFGDIRAYPPGQYEGIVVLRLKRQDKSHVLETISRLVGVLSQEPLQGRLWVVQEDRIRIRG